jgi:hypothetical protein
VTTVVLVSCGSGLVHVKFSALLRTTEVVVLHDPEAEKSLVILFFATEDDYMGGDEVLSAMPADDTPGRRTSVTKYDVPIR